MRKPLIICGFLVLSGCSAGHDYLIVLHNPKTGQTVQCQDDARLFGSKSRVRNCAESYERIGFVRAKPN